MQDQNFIEKKEDTFNLLNESWIKVAMKAGGTEELSLLEVFKNAENISSIRGEIAAQDLAILRLLIAIVHRAIQGPEDIDEWLELWNDKSSLHDDVISYLEKYRSRFNVRDKDQPFFQVAGIHAPNGTLKELEALIADVPNNKPLFTTRAGSELEKISWAEASRWLIHVHAFDPSGIRTGAVGDPFVKSGKGYPIGPGWTGQIGAVFFEGSNLLETVLLNLVPYSREANLEGVDFTKDLPPWEQDQLSPAQRHDLNPIGPVGAYTWQSRRILLHGDESGVTSLFIGNGDKANLSNQIGVEPMTAWRYSKNQSKKEGYDIYLPLMHDSSKAFWRVASSYIPSLAKKSKDEKLGVDLFKAPSSTKFFAELINMGVISDSKYIPLRAVGYQYGTQNALITEAVNDELLVPVILFDEEHETLDKIMQNAIDDAAQASSLIQSFAANLMNAQGASPELVTASRNRASTQFYQKIDAKFPDWLLTLQDSPNAAALRWRETLHTVLRELEFDLMQSVPPTAYAGRDRKNYGRMDVGRALAILRGSTRKYLPIEK